MNGDAYALDENGRFDVDGYLLDVAEYLEHPDPAARQAARKELTALDPLLFAFVYLGHHLQDESTGGTVSFSRFHLDLCRDARGWARPSGLQEDRDAYVAPREAGKPVHDGAMILMGDGTRKPLRDVKVGDAVITHRGRPRRVEKVFVQGKLPTVRIRTWHGRETIAALDHPFLTTEGWKNAGDLRPGDVVANVAAPDTITDDDGRCAEEFRLAGYFIGDGNTTRVMRKGKPYGWNAHVSCADPVEAADLRRIAERLGFTVTTPPSAPERYSFGGGARQWLRDADLAGLTSHTKRVPDWVMRASPAMIAEFLGAYIACDGHVSTTTRAPTVEFYSVSEGLMRDVQHLLLRLGIQSRLRRKRGTYKRAEHLSWRLAVGTEDDVARLAALLPVYNTKGEALSALPSRRRRFDAPLYGDEVVAVEDAGERDCRCLTVADDHTFTADDLVVHNSTWLFLILPLWAAAHGHRRFVVALADSATQAQGHLANLTLELDTNELLRADFPDLCAVASRERVERAVSDNRGMTMRRDGTVFAARGLDSKMLGLKVRNRRPDLIILDDVEPQGARYGPELIRKRLKTIRDAVLPLNNRARVVLSGTVTIAGSIVHQLVQSKITTEDPEPWIEAENFRVHYYDVLQVDEETGEQRSLWPEKWPIEWILEQLGDDSFELNMRNRPVSGVGTFWEREDIRYGHPAAGCAACREAGVTDMWEGPEPPGHRPVYGNTILAIDPAVTKRDTSDYTGFAVVSRGPDNAPGRVYVRHAERRRVAAKLRRPVSRLLDTFPDITVVYIETNQGGEVWGELLHDLPVKVREVHQDEPKHVRAARAVTHYRRRRVYHTRVLPAAEDEMLNYPNGLHDDTLDAVDSGVNYFLEAETPKAAGRGQRWQGTYAPPRPRRLRLVAG